MDTASMSTTPAVERSNERAILWTLLRAGIVLILLAATCVFIVRTWHWPFIWDAATFRYINFLVAHGFHPYRDIVDMNLPGCYLVDWFAWHTLGGGDLAWRMYDLLLLAALTVAAIVITKPYEWIGGLYAGVQFALFHSLDGPYHLGQRDQVLTVLEVCAYAFLFSAVRKNRPWLTAGLGFCIGIATSVKPTAAPLGIIVLLLACWNEHRNGRKWSPLVGWSLLGAAIPTAVVLGYLEYHHAFGALLEITRRITPFYSSLTNLPLSLLVRRALPLRLTALWLIVLAWNIWRSPRDREVQWERWALLIGFLASAFSFYIQHKGYPYHRYPLTAFLLVSFGMELGVFERTNLHFGRLAIVCLALLSLTAIPVTLRDMMRVGGVTQNQFATTLEQDLRGLGESNLQHSVQCLDLVDGCYSALYRERLVQSTGHMGDLLLFSRTPSPVVDYYRADFLKAMQRNPPNVIIESNEWYGEQADLDKIYAWPSMAQFLLQNYHPVITRQFTDHRRSAYRIYARNGYIY